MSKDTSLLWVPDIGFSKPLMDLRDDAPMPSPPDDPPATEGFWHSCTAAVAVPGLDQFDNAVVVLPAGFETAVVIEQPGFDAEVLLL